MIDKKESLNAWARNETSLIWHRYSAMIVCNSVLLGFLASLFSAANPSFDIGLLGSFFGLAAAILWWLMTSYGWLILHIMIDSACKELIPIYKKRRKRVLIPRPTWCTAHALISLFYFAYFYIGWRCAKELGHGNKFFWTYSLISGFLFLFLLIYSFTRLSIKRK
jgi:small-conductance mechanosensitive channel